MKKRFSAACACLAFLLLFASCQGGSSALAGSSALDGPSGPAASGDSLETAKQTAAEAAGGKGTLRDTPSQYRQFFQAGKVNVDIDAPIEIPQVESIKQYRAVPAPVHAALAIEALGGEVPEDGDPFGPSAEPMEMQFVSDGEHEYIFNAGGFSPNAFIDVRHSYVAAPENRVKRSPSEKPSPLSSQALAASEKAAAAMGLDLALNRVEEYEPCPAETALAQDIRQPTDQPFAVVSLVQELDGMLLKWATRNVQLFQDPQTGVLHRYSSDPLGTIGLRFTVSGGRICDLQGAYFTFEELRTLTEILPLEEAAAELRRNPDLLCQAVKGDGISERSSQSVQTLRIDKISFQYVYDKYYLTQFAGQGLRLDPMWCFEGRLESGEEVCLFVSALDGRMSYLRSSQPTDRLPASQPFPDSVFYTGK
ncbi:MAG: hypothetical protein HFG26_06560 [Provencibacterium sp.]|jgi:hypothetical protein|nr:hypothetical protein [Provencibacterium sp.]